MVEDAGSRFRAMLGRRPAFIGFLVGFAVTVPATFLALLFNWAEALYPIIVPAQLVLGPVSQYAADWPAAVTMVLVSLANGVIYSPVAVVVAWLVRSVRGR